MKGLHSKALVAISGAMLLGANKVYAISELDIQNNSLDFYASRYSLVEEIQKYFKKNGLSKEEYEKYIKLSKKYRYSSEDIWIRIESGTSLLDHILFANKIIKEDYESRIESKGSQEKAYESLKRDILNNPEYILKIIEEESKNVSKMKSAFKAKYGRVPSKKELLWLEDKESVKYALYGGELGREITKIEYDLIQRGYGYKIFNLYDYEIEEYMEYATIRDKIMPLEVKYYNSIEIFMQIYIKIYNNFNIDIYKALTEKERLEIHKQSVEGIEFNSKTAYKLVKEKLKKKGLLDKGSSEKLPEQNNETDKDEITENLEDENILKDLSTSNPINELDKYLKENNSNIRDALLSNIKNLYKTPKIQYTNNLRDKYIHFKYKGKSFSTHIRVDQDGKLSKERLKNLIMIINESLNSKMIFSSKEVLLLEGNQINTSKLAMRDNVLFEELSNGFKGVGIVLYEEEIAKDKGKKEEETSSYIEKRFLQIDLQNESYQVPYEEDGYVTNVNFKTMLDMIGVKYIFATDTVLIMNQGKVSLVKNKAYLQGFVTLEEIESILDNAGIEYTLKIIKRKEK